MGGSARSHENEMEGCEDGCPTNSSCQWGVCHCLPGHLQAWGRCVLERDPDFHTSLLQPNRVQGTECATSIECQASDINLVCKGSSRKQCKCKDPTRWNSKTSECQIYIGVDCAHLSRDSPVPEVLRLSAATATIVRRGYCTETDDKRQLEALGLSGPYVETLLGRNRGRSSPWNDPFSTAEETPIPLDRTETREEALKYSLLSFLPTNISRPDLLEAICRDLEAFSDIFQMEDLHHRPPSCPPIERQHCAVLFDSSTCSEGSWRLNVTDGEQRQLGYFSSDWKYRNDADTLGVRRGCTFIGYTNDNFDSSVGSFVLTSGARDRWVVFALSPKLEAFHESILSYQCVCREEEREQSNSFDTRLG